MKQVLSFCMLFVALTCTLMSCDSNRLYETNHDFSDHMWKASDRQEFEFRIEDTGKKYNIYYNIRNTLNYPYSRIFVTYHLHDSLGTELESKLNMQDLFDEKSGAPFGSSNLGDLYDHQFMLLPQYEFRFPGTYKLTLEQYTRQDTLRGVMAVGARVEVAPPNP